MKKMPFAKYCSQKNWKMDIEPSLHSVTDVTFGSNHLRAIEAQDWKGGWVHACISDMGGDAYVISEHDLTVAS